MSLYNDYNVREYILSLYKTQIAERGLLLDQVPDDFDLLMEGIVDSLGIMELVTALETHFAHPIDFEELDAEQMTILGPLSSHVQRKLTEVEALTGSEGLGLTMLPTGVVKVKGRVIEVWVAQDDQSIRKGLMGVEAHELAPLSDGSERGMLFLFEKEQPRSFWMFKTIVPLDIIYIDDKCRVINSYSAQPLEIRLLYPSKRPAQYVLEVPSGLVQKWGIEEGDTIELPPNLLSISLQ